MEPGITRSGSIKSFKNLWETVVYAQIDPELFFLLQKPETCRILEEQLSHQYFYTTQKLLPTAAVKAARKFIEKIQV